MVRKIPQSKIEGKYKPEYAALYEVGRKKFRKMQAEAGVEVTKGRSAIVARTGTKLRALLQQDRIGYSTFCRKRALQGGKKKAKENRKRKKQLTPADECKALAQRWRAQFRLTKSDMKETMGELLTITAFLRDLLRLGIDPTRQTVTWREGKLSGEAFSRLTSWVNKNVKSKPSLHKAFYGSVTESMHNHNVIVDYDAWSQNLRALVSKLDAKAVPLDVQVQYVSMCNTFNSADVVDSLIGSKKADLPIHYDKKATIIDNEARITQFLRTLISKGKTWNPYSIRFQGYKYNACKSTWTRAHEEISKDLPSVLSQEEAKCLPQLESYTEKQRFLSRKPGYSKNLDESFRGKNLCNSLAMLGRHVGPFRSHRISSLKDHPDGPEAAKFYCLSNDGDEDEDVRGSLVAAVRGLHPRCVYVDGVRLDGLAIKARSDVTDEFVQFNSCAAYRIVKYLVTGIIPRHLKRNAVLQGKKGKKRKLD